MRSLEQREHDRPARLEPAVEVDGGDHRLHRVGEDRRLVASARTRPRPCPAAATARGRAPRATSASASAFTTDGAHLGQLALGQLRVLLVDVVGDDEAEHGVAEELEPLVRLLDAVLRAVRPVRQRLVEEAVVDERPAERELQPSVECRVDGTAPPSGHQVDVPPCSALQAGAIDVVDRVAHGVQVAEVLVVDA